MESGPPSRARVEQEISQVGRVIAEADRRAGIAVLAMLLLLLVARAPAQTIPLYGEPDGPGFGVVAGEVGGAVLSGAALGIGLGLAANRAAGGPSDLFDGPVLPILAGVGGLAVGSTAGSGLGTWLVGSIARQDHHASWAFLGALAGVPVCLGFGYAAARLEQDEKPGALLLIPALAASPAGAVLLYNLSPPCSCAKTSRLQDRLLLPTAGLSRERPGKTGTVALDMRLVSIRL